MTHTSRFPVAACVAACAILAACVLHAQAATAVVDDQSAGGGFSAPAGENGSVLTPPQPAIDTSDAMVQPTMAPENYGEVWEEPYYDDALTRFWVRPEYLLWFTKAMELPALVTASPSNTPQNEAGVLGEETTFVIYGIEQIAHKARNGGRLTIGYWFDDYQDIGIVASGLGVSHDYSGNFSAESTGNPILARPFFNVQTNQEDAELVAFPNVLSGKVSASTTSELQSGDILLRRNRDSGYGARLDCLVGYRFFRLREGLQIEENLISTNPGGLVQQGTTLDLFDRFSTQNDFHGVELGLSQETDGGNWSLEIVGKVALGTMFETVDINGQTVVTTPGDPSATSAGGLLALPTNIGTYHSDNFCVIPELNVNLHWWFTDRLNLTFGYTGIYVSEVVRSADQIDGSVDPRQLPGFGTPGSAVIDRPAALFRTADFWVQGANLGMEYMW